VTSRRGAATAVGNHHRCVARSQAQPNHAATAMTIPRRGRRKDEDAGRAHSIAANSTRRRARTQHRGIMKRGKKAVLA